MDEFIISPSEAQSRRSLPVHLPACDRCGLYRKCQSPKMKIDGEGRRRILLVSEYPGKDEDANGRPLVGGMGRFLESKCQEIGLDMRRDCWLTNATICYSQHISSHKTAVTDCRPNLLNDIKNFNPVAVVLLGMAAVRSLIGYAWKPDTGLISRWVGHEIPAHNPNVWLLPTYNPAHVMRDDKDAPVKLQSLRRTLKAAASIETIPWPDGPPDYSKRVELVYDPDQAASRLDEITSGIAAFDYETTTIKPEGPKSEIVCASVCYDRGRKTIAFPWHGPVKKAMRRLLTDPNVGKIGYNAKFEDRWTRVHLGVAVDPWYWDGMLTAHAIDPRSGGSGLKFQSFVRFGMPDYNSHVEPYLFSQDKGGYAPNRARQVKLELLMRYCGIDSLLEYKVAKQQAEEVGVDWDD